MTKKIAHETYLFLHWTFHNYKARSSEPVYFIRRLIKTSRQLFASCYCSRRCLVSSTSLRVLSCSVLLCKLTRSINWGLKFLYTVYLRDEQVFPSIVSAMPGLIFVSIRVSARRKYYEELYCHCIL